MEKPAVFFLKSDDVNGIIKILPVFKSELGVKVHFGEQGNTTYIPADLIKQITTLVKEPTLIECGVLYKSPRRTTSGHMAVALSHGFDFAPIDFLDGEKGDDYIEVDSAGKHFQKIYLGKNLAKYDSLLVISHFKGHQTEGFGGAIKNLGMGLASRRGKLAQHASVKHIVNQEKCISCGICISDCPVNAIKLTAETKAVIDQEKCISCSKCISVCPVEAIGIPWSTAKEIVQERTAEYAKAAVLNKQCFYINFLINITKDCDCSSEAMPKLIEDIGILASNDPVAIDQASLDMVLEHYKAVDRFNGEAQLRYGQEIGLGKRKYELKNL